MMGFPVIFRSRKTGKADNLFLHDEFTDTDDVYLPDHTIAPVNKLGLSWSRVDLGTFNTDMWIKSNKARNRQTGNNAYVVVDPGIATGVKLTMTHYSGIGSSYANYPGFIYRYMNKDNQWNARPNSTNGEIEIYSRVGGSSVKMAGLNVGFGQNQTILMTLILSGNYMEFTVSGDCNGTISYTSSSLNDKTKMGFGTYLAGTVSSWIWLDDFKIEYL